MEVHTRKVDLRKNLLEDWGNKNHVGKCVGSDALNNVIEDRPQRSRKRPIIEYEDIVAKFHSPVVSKRKLQNTKKDLIPKVRLDRVTVPKAKPVSSAKAVSAVSTYQSVSVTSHAKLPPSKNPSCNKANDLSSHSTEKSQTTTSSPLPASSPSKLLTRNSAQRIDSSVSRQNISEQQLSPKLLRQSASVSKLTTKTSHPRSSLITSSESKQQHAGMHDLVNDESLISSSVRVLIGKARQINDKVTCTRSTQLTAGCSLCARRYNEHINQATQTDPVRFAEEMQNALITRPTFKDFSVFMMNMMNLYERVAFDEGTEPVQVVLKPGLALTEKEGESESN